MIDSQFHYSENEHAFYRDQGYYIFNRFLAPDALGACGRQIDAMLVRRHNNVPIDQMISTHQQEAWVFRLATEPLLLDMIERQIGPDILLWSSHLLCKPPRTGQLVPWHQDAPYWNITGRFSASAWIAFDDITEKSGAMSVLPGWHCKGVLPIEPSPFDRGFTQQIVPSALPTDLAQKQVQYVMRAGQMAIHHVMMPHNSPPNHSDHWRRVLVLRYIAADGCVGPSTYQDYRTGSDFNREVFLVRGISRNGTKPRHSPF